MEVPENHPLPSEKVEGNREESTREETPQEPVVGCTGTEHLLGSKGTPEDGSGEELVDVRTSKFILLVWCANVRDLRHLVVEDSRGDEGGNDGSERLAAAGD